MTEKERRTHHRLSVNAVVGIDAESRKDRVGMTRNISATGLVFHSASKFKPGDSLELKLRPPQQSAEHHVTATVVRTLEEPFEKATPFPHVTAVKFAQPISAACDSDK